MLPMSDFGDKLLWGARSSKNLSAQFRSFFMYVKNILFDSSHGLLNIIDFFESIFLVSAIFSTGFFTEKTFSV